MAEYQPEVEQITSGIAELSLPITVLSWNINGSTEKGTAYARRKMIRSVVRHINPDVMLLQETKNSITRLFNEFPMYKCEKAEDEEEAQVLYKNTFEKVFPSRVNLDKILEEMFPANQTVTLRSEVPDRRVVRERVCVVHLRHKCTRREIIFVSYHNIRKGGGSGAVIKKATEFCQILAKLHESSKCCVIAGVDFNCFSFDRTLVTVPDYDAILRRQKKPMVDFFLLSKYDVLSPTPQLLPVTQVQPIPVPILVPPGQLIPLPPGQPIQGPPGQPIQVPPGQPIPVPPGLPIPVPPGQPIPVPPGQPIPVTPVQPIPVQHIPPLLSYSVEAFDIFPQKEDVPFYKEFISLLGPHSKKDYDKALDHDPLKLSLEPLWGMV